MGDPLATGGTPDNTGQVALGPDGQWHYVIYVNGKETLGSAVAPTPATALPQNPTPGTTRSISSGTTFNSTPQWVKTNTNQQLISPDGTVLLTLPLEGIDPGTQAQIDASIKNNAATNAQSGANTAATETGANARSAAQIAANAQIATGRIDTGAGGFLNSIARDQLDQLLAQNNRAYALDVAKFGLSQADLNARQRTADAQQRLDELKLQASMRGPANAIGYNYLLGNRAAPTGTEKPPATDNGGGPTSNIQIPPDPGATGVNDPKYQRDLAVAKALSDQWNAAHPSAPPAATPPAAATPAPAIQGRAPAGPAENAAGNAFGQQQAAANAGLPPAAQAAYNAAFGGGGTWGMAKGGMITMPPDSQMPSPDPMMGGGGAMLAGTPDTEGANDQPQDTEGGAGDTADTNQAWHSGFMAGQQGMPLAANPAYRQAQQDSPEAAAAFLDGYHMGQVASKQTPAPAAKPGGGGFLGTLSQQSAGQPPMAGGPMQGMAGGGMIAHPGFQGAAAQVAAKQGIPMANAQRIIGAGKAHASAAARKKNPRLNKVAHRAGGGVAQGMAMVGDKHLMQTGKRSGDEELAMPTMRGGKPAVRIVPIPRNMPMPAVKHRDSGGMINTDLTGGTANTMYSPQDIANTPAVRQATGAEPTPSYGAFAGSTTIPGTDTSIPFGAQQNYTTLQDMQPSSQALLQSIVSTPKEQGGLGLEWSDFLESSRRGAPIGKWGKIWGRASGPSYGAQ